MKKKRVFVIFILILLFSCKAEKNDAVYQYSTINALLEGVFDGDITLASLKNYGDFGIGTFNTLDGEMILLDGVIYGVKSDGKVYRMDENGKTPFAVVKHFNKDESFHKPGKTDLKSLTEYLDQKIHSKNIFYAFKIYGFFKYVKTRSVPPQNKPYPKLADVTKTQPVFEYKNIKGTIIGFRVPEYAKGINVAGYHFHFIDADKKTGGHLLVFESDELSIEIDNSGSLIMLLPETEEFYKKNISGEKEAEIKKVEK
jgi:acetolactate decarboxylase